MTLLVFDIETIPDLEAGRRLYHLDGLSDQETAAALSALRRAKVGHDFLPHYLQKIVAIALVLNHNGHLQVWSLGDESSDEAELIQRFFHGVEKYMPTLISWNGSGFDLPVLHYRALLHGITAKTYWEVGETQPPFRWNNYLNRFHYRHLDLMDVLAGYQNKAFAPLDDLASLIGYPGKMGMNGAQVFDEYLKGHLKQIRDYCETDVLNTYGVYLHFERMRGTLTAAAHAAAEAQLYDYLHQHRDKVHFNEFLMHWSFRTEVPTCSL